MKNLVKNLVGISALAIGSIGTAAPIVYQGDLTNVGTVQSTLQTDAWWRFSASAGDIITVTARRLEAALDPAMYLFAGVANDSNLLSMLAFGDDEIAAEGPYGDPMISDYAISQTGDYSIRVMSYFSGYAGADNAYSYSVSLVNSNAANVTEPATMSILALSLLGFIGFRRKFC